MMQSLKFVGALARSGRISSSFRNKLLQSSHYYIGLKPETLAEPASVPDYLQPHACQSVESVLQLVRENKVSFYDTAGLLKTLRVQALLKNIQAQDLTCNSSFHNLCYTFVMNCHKLSPSLVVSGLRSLLQIGIPSDSFEITTVEKVILNRVSDFDMTQLIGCLHLHSKYLITDLQKQVVAKLVNEIGIRISEINEPAEVIMLAQLTSFFDKELLRKVQEKMVELMLKMNTKDLIRVISTISESANRNKTLLKSASHCLQGKSMKPDIRDTLNILHSLNSLNFYDLGLLSFLINDREEEIAAVEQPGLISALLTACGLLKWRHEGMLNACTQWIKNHFEACSTRELISLILTCAALNYMPQDVEVLNKIISSLQYEQVGQKDVWLDFVWSCAVLELINKEMLLDVLSPEFYQTLLGDSDFRSVGVTLKLMNLKYVLKTLYPECIFSCNFFLEPKQVTRSKESEACRRDVLSALNNLVPNNTFMCSNICTHMGITIDAEFIMSKKGKPLPLVQYGLKDEPSLKPKPLPSGAKRVALMIWLFRDYTLSEKCLTGVNELAVRLLKAQGYVVVQVPYDTFVKQQTEVKKAVYLSHLISESISEFKIKK